jgi:hypothetical protein
MRCDFVENWKRPHPPISIARNRQDRAQNQHLNESLPAHGIPLASA